MVVFGLSKNLLFRSILGRCESLKFFFKFQKPRLLKSAKMSSEPLAQPELIVTGSIEKKKLEFQNLIHFLDRNYFNMSNSLTIDFYFQSLSELHLKTIPFSRSSLPKIMAKFTTTACLVGRLHKIRMELQNK